MLQDDRISRVHMQFILRRSHVFFFNDTATTEIYTLSLHDALPISQQRIGVVAHQWQILLDLTDPVAETFDDRSEEHTSELQSRQYLVCRLLLEKKNILNQ